ncbi:MAG TPA: pitrilysin family protein [Gemmatimonadota bacterium]|nr:pitrilysin family protein [Gemmatimonadota bacterium]
MSTLAGAFTARGGHSPVVGASAVVAFLAAALLGVATLPAQAPDRSEPPELGPPPDFDLPPIQRFHLSNGLEVMLLEKHQVPLVQIHLVVDAGSIRDPEGKKGLASMAAAMLDEGAGERDALALADAIDYLGADLGISAGEHTTVVRLHTPLARLDPALEIMADIALRPTFPAEELERQRIERLTTLLQWRDEPRAIAAVAFAETLYGEIHPYGVPAIGTAEGLQSITPEDLSDYHAAHFRPGNATLIVVGDVTGGTLSPLLEAAFGAWNGGSVTAAGLPAAGVPPAEQVEARHVTLIDKPGAAQSEIRIGRIGVPRLTDDYYSILVMNTILGGSFTSRLNQNLREDKGYSYGAFSAFDFRPGPGPFLAAAAVQTEVTAEALTEFMRELTGILEAVTETELERARNYLALGFPQEFQTVAGTAGMLGELAVYDLPDDTFDRYIERVQAVTVADVQRVARQYLDPEKVAIIVVGDREVVEAPIRALDLGPVEVRTIEEALGPPPVVSVP